MDASLNENPQGTTLSPDVLLERMERVRVLAGQLVRQAADRDDLVQEAVARALAQPQVLIGDPEPWLRRVLKNLVIDRQRSHQRRQRREEEAVPREVHAPSAAESVARAEKQRDLVDTVLELKDPYRTVLLRRYFDGEPPRRIAEELGVPVPTVKKQLERGMAMVRANLEGRYGDRGAWAVALLPILPSKALRALPKVLPATSRTASLALPAGILGAAAIGITLVSLGPLGRRSVEPLATDIVPGESVAADPSEREAGLLASREPNERAALSDAVAANASGALGTRTFSAVFLTEEGLPIEGVTVQRAEDEARSRASAATAPLGTSTDAGQLAAVPVATGITTLVTEADGYAPATLRIPATGSFNAGEQTLYASVDLSVRVVDARGQALDGWTTSYFHHNAGGRLDRGRATVSAATGRATFEGVGAAPVEINAEHPSGARIDHPRRRLLPGRANEVDLVYAGPDPSRRIGITLVAPPLAQAVALRPLAVGLERSGTKVTEESVDPALGSTAFEGLEPELGVYSLHVDDPRFEPVEAWVDPGQRTTLTLRGSAGIELHTDSTSPSITRAVALGIEPTPAAPSEAGRAALAFSVEGGALRIDNLVPGQPFTLWLESEGGPYAALPIRELQPGEVRRIDAARGDGLTKQLVRVTQGNKAGEETPVVGARIGLFAGHLTPGGREEREALAWLKNGLRTAPSSFVARGQTDRAGELRVAVPTAQAASNSNMTPRPWTVLTSHGEGARAHFGVGRRPGTIALRLAPTGSLELRVTGLRRPLPPGAALTLVGPSLGASMGSPADGVPGLPLTSEGEGRFTAEAVPAGTAHLMLAFQDFNRVGRGTPLGAPTGALGVDLGEVTIPVGEQITIERDLIGLAPARRFALTVLRDGTAIRDAVVELTPTRTTAAALIRVQGRPQPMTPDSLTIARLTDGTGRALFEFLPKGTWNVRVRASNWLWTSSTGEVTVSESQASLTLPVTLCEGVIRVRRDSDPSGETSLWIEFAPGVKREWKTDEEGRLRLLLGPGSYRVFNGPDDSQPAGTLTWTATGPLEPTLQLEVE